ncbi:MAG: TonB-dependent receptor [Bacteroidia bacterium]|nr:TonB-dependent receptor [Bacteroidia bacterium]
MKIILFAFLIELTSFWSIAQEDKTLTGDFRDVKFIDFTNQIENKTKYEFFYNPASMDSLKINISVIRKTIPEILDELFQNTEIRYAIDENYSVYISIGRSIATDLPFGFFNDGERLNVQKNNDQDYSPYEEVEKSKENKLYTIGLKTANSRATANIAGYVRNSKSGEPVIGATVFIETPLIGVATDQFGYFSITLSKGRHELIAKSIGLKSAKYQVMLYSDGKLDIELLEDITPLKEIVVQADRDVAVLGLQMGLERLDIKTIKQIPVALGEVDIFKAILTLPGVQSVGEGTVGLNVRGGASNQNLILYNDATIFNPSHFFGFFSAFNPDILKNVELYKSGIPAEYGGRLSAVLDVSTRDGNKRKFSGSGGISPVTGRFALEGPIIKDKTSFLIAGRSTYSNWLLTKIPSITLKNSQASFYDANMSLSHQMDDKNTFYASGYISKDGFKLGSDTTYKYSNQTASAKWKHIFGNKFYGILTASYSGYDYDVSSDANSINSFQLSYFIQQANIKADFTYFLNSKHTLNFGVSTIHYKLSPGEYQPLGTASLVAPDILQKEQGEESALYVGDNYEITSRLSLYAGLRYSLFQNLGPKEIYMYDPNSPKSKNSILDTVQISSGQKVASYNGPEYRFSMRYTLTSSSSIKFGYNKMRQYLQMLSTTAAASPIDIWKLSDSYVKPQLGDQFSLGYYHNLKANLETSVEVYYKTMENFLDFKGGAKLILNHHIETDVVNATGKAYGAEFMIKKVSGKLNGWLSYTYSRSFLQTKGVALSESINEGNWYPSNYDKPNAVNFIGNYKFSRRFSMSLNMTYSTGRPITLPLAKYDVNGSKRLYYSERNQYRIPDYFRTDFALNIEGNHKIKKLAHSSWIVAVYNLTGRRNAYSIYFTSTDNVVKGYKLSIFGNAIPTITYNFRF